MTESAHDVVERCPRHPDVEPDLATVHETRSHQAGMPTRIVMQPRCPVCG